MSEKKLRGVSITQENGFVAQLNWMAPVDTEEAELLLNVFEIALRPLRRLAGYEQGSGPELTPKEFTAGHELCKCGHSREAHKPGLGCTVRGGPRIEVGVIPCECCEFEKWRATDG